MMIKVLLLYDHSVVVDVVVEDNNVIHLKNKFLVHLWMMILQTIMSYMFHVVVMAMMIMIMVKVLLLLLLVICYENVSVYFALVAMAVVVVVINWLLFALFLDQSFVWSLSTLMALIDAMD